ncbi:unnamed protein product [Lathyrus oleraceus]
MHYFDEGLAEGDNGMDDVDVAATNEPPNHSFSIEEMEKGTYEDTCEDMPALIRFIEKEPMAKDFTCKVGMKFSFLKQFKKAILEYIVLNDRKVRFSKIGAMRCMVVCKHKKLRNCNVLCNMVLRCTTFKIETLFHKYNVADNPSIRVPRMNGLLQ